MRAQSLTATDLRRAGMALALVLAGALGSTSAALAAIPPLSPEELHERSSDIAVGRVRQVYTATRSTKPGFADKLFCLEIAVEHVEKGHQLRAGQLIHVRAWRPEERPLGFAGPQGQNVIPAAGDLVRAFVRRAEDGGLDLLAPNGVGVVALARLEGKLVKKPWTKSLESYQAGGGEYFVIETASGSRVLQPSSQATAAALAALDGREVTVEGADVRGRVPPADDASQRPMPAPGAEPVEQGGGFQVFAVTPKG